MKRLFAAALLLMLLPRSLSAAESLTIDVSSTDSVETDCSYIRLKIPVAETSNVSVTLSDENGHCLYCRDYGSVSADFRTEDIVLQLSGSNTSYTVTAKVADTSYSVPVTRVAGKLTGQPACSIGYPLAKLTGSHDWQCATLLDITALQGSSLTTPLLASGCYNAGSVSFSVRNGKLTVSVTGIGSTVDSASVYVARTPAEAKKLGRKGFSGIKSKPGKAIDLEGTKCVAVFVDARLSFSADELGSDPSHDLSGQDAIWENMKSQQ